MFVKDKFGPVPCRYPSFYKRHSENLYKIFNTILYRRKDPLNKYDQPTVNVSSSGKLYSGTSKFKGAGPFLILPEIS